MQIFIQSEYLAVDEVIALFRGSYYKQYIHKTKVFWYKDLQTLTRLT
jgi:hypothetical protein